MILFAILIVVFLIAKMVPAHGHRRASRDAARLAMAAAMVFSGVSHFADTAAFVQLLPEFVPGRTPLVLATGVLEILLGAGLLAPRWRREVALILVGYLVAVFPANVYVAVADVSLDGLGGGNPWLRLPFQVVYIAWVVWAVPGAVEPARDLIRRFRGTPREPIQPAHGAVSR